MLTVTLPPHFISTLPPVERTPLLLSFAVTVTLALLTSASPAADTPLLLSSAVTLTLPPDTVAVPVEYIPCNPSSPALPVKEMAPAV